MSRLTLIAGVAVLALAGPAAAQVGELTGQVGGSTDVQTPPLGSTLDNAAGLTRDTVDRTRDAAPAVQGQANADGSISTGPDTTGADLDVQAGAMVHASDGAMVGTVSSVVRDSAGRAESLIVQTANGARTVPAAGASVQGDIVIGGWTKAEFDAAVDAE